MEIYGTKSTFWENLGFSLENAGNYKLKLSNLSPKRGNLSLFWAIYRYFGPILPYFYCFWDKFGLKTNAKWQVDTHVEAKNATFYGTFMNALNLGP